MTIIEHDAAAHCFHADVEGHRALLEYVLAGDVMTITHTVVPAAIGGRGIAAELTREALAKAKASHWQVVAACSYAAAYMARQEGAARRQHDEALLDEALDESYPASDPPSVGRSD